MLSQNLLYFYLRYYRVKTFLGPGNFGTRGPRSTLVGIPLINSQNKSVSLVIGNADVLMQSQVLYYLYPSLYMRTQ